MPSGRACGAELPQGTPPAVGKRRGGRGRCGKFSVGRVKRCIFGRWEVGGGRRASGSSPKGGIVVPSGRACGAESPQGTPYAVGNRQRGHRTSRGSTSRPRNNGKKNSFGCVPSKIATLYPKKLGFPHHPRPPRRFPTAGDVPCGDSTRQTHLHYPLMPPLGLLSDALLPPPTSHLPKIDFF